MTMLTDNSYAIGPSLYDFSYDQWEKEQAIEESIEEEADENKNNLAAISTVMTHGERVFIHQMMAEAMAVITDNETDQDDFNRWLWQIWACYSRQREPTEKALTMFAVERVVGMIDKAIVKVARQQAKNRINQ